MDIRRRSGIVVYTATNVRITLITVLSARDAASDFLTPSSSCAPKHWLVLTEKPEVSPWTKPIMSKDMEFVTPTPARAWLEMVCPTIIVSTMLYSC